MPGAESRQPANWKAPTDTAAEVRSFVCVLLHSIALARLVGLLVTLQAYVHPFTAPVLK